MDKKIEKYLKDYSINYKEYAHEAVFTVAESRDLKKSIPGMHCKCLFLKSDSENFYLVAMPAEKRLDFNRLRKTLKVGKLHFASEKELFDLLCLKAGSVSIFGLINDTYGRVNFILDKAVWDASFCGFHPNINTSTIVISHDALERFYNSLKTNKLVGDL